MNDIISAKQALNQSLLNESKLEILFKKKIESEKSKQDREKRLNQDKYFLDISTQIRENIKTAIEIGEKHISIVLKDNFSRHLAKESFEFYPIIEKIMKFYSDQGYVCDCDKGQLYHDTSFEYLNSGGECGSSTPYYSDALYLTIDWSK